MAGIEKDFTAADSNVSKEKLYFQTRGPKELQDTVKILSWSKAFKNEFSASLPSKQDTKCDSL